MSSFGTAKHAHVDASVFAAILTLLTYCVKWVLGLSFPAFLFAVPFFVAVFFAYYAVLFVVFAGAWAGK
jgi:hypothetical protein